MKKRAIDLQVGEGIWRRQTPCLIAAIHGPDDRGRLTVVSATGDTYRIHRESMVRMQVGQQPAATEEV